jgi:hypothetical protein
VQRLYTVVEGTLIQGTDRNYKLKLQTRFSTSSLLYSNLEVEIIF